MHPVFHVSQLKAYVPDPEDEDRNQARRPPPNVRVVFGNEAEAILDRRVIDRGGRHGCYRNIEYLVKWAHRPVEGATWERDIDLWQFDKLVQQFESDRASVRTPTDFGGGGV